MQHAVIDVTTNEKLFCGTLEQCQEFLATCECEWAYIFRIEWEN